MNTTSTLGITFYKVFWDSIKYQLKIDEYPTKHKKTKSQSISKYNSLQNSVFQKPLKIQLPTLEIEEPNKDQEFQQKLIQIKIDEIESWYFPKI